MLFTTGACAGATVATTVLFKTGDPVTGTAWAETGTGDPGKTGAGGTAPTPTAGGSAPTGKAFVGGKGAGTAEATGAVEVTLGAIIGAVPLAGAVKFAALTRGAKVGVIGAEAFATGTSLMLPILLFINPIFGAIRLLVLKKQVETFQNLKQ